MKRKFTIGYVVLSLVAMAYLYINNNQNVEAISQLENTINNSLVTSSVSEYSDTYKNELLLNDRIKTKSISTRTNTIPDSKTVYLTNTGHKYHATGCRYLKSSCTAVSLDQALSMGKTPCSVCNP